MNQIYKIKNQLCSDIQSEEEVHHHVPTSCRPRFINEIMAKHRNRQRTQFRRRSRLKAQQQPKTYSNAENKQNLISLRQKNRKKQKEIHQEECLQKKITYVHGNKIEGTWKNGNLHGHVVIYYETGEYFEGNYSNGIRIQGKVKFKDGTEYVGGFLKDIFHGQGSLKDPSGRVITCEWQEGQPGRKAKIEYPSGDIYFGQIFNLKKHGQGHLFFTNGSKYVGRFVNGEITGYGSYYEKDKKIAEGIWQNGILQIQQNVKQIVLESLKNQKVVDLQLLDQRSHIVIRNKAIVANKNLKQSIILNKNKNEDQISSILI